MLLSYCKHSNYEFIMNYRGYSVYNKNSHPFDEWLHGYL